MGIQVSGLDAAIRGMTKSSGELDRALGNTLHQALPNSAGGEMRGRASSMGVMESRAAGSARVHPLYNGVQVEAGTGDPFFKGSEFGGRKRRKRPHIVHSPRGKAYVVRKRTTMNFQPSVGKVGYFVTPVVKHRLSGIRSKLLKRVLKEVSSP